MSVQVIYHFHHPQPLGPYFIRKINGQSVHSVLDLSGVRLLQWSVK